VRGVRGVTSEPSVALSPLDPQTHKRFSPTDTHIQILYSLDRAAASTSARRAAFILSGPGAAQTHSALCTQVNVIIERVSDDASLFQLACSGLIYYIEYV
jgi:hypothetical protein